MQKPPVGGFVELALCAPVELIYSGLCCAKNELREEIFVVFAQRWCIICATLYGNCKCLHLESSTTGGSTRSVISESTPSLFT